jgi:hypothetical protein
MARFLAVDDRDAGDEACRPTQRKGEGHERLLNHAPHDAD